MAIKQSVINTFGRIGINPEQFDNTAKNVTVANRFGGGSVQTTELLAKCIDWVYNEGEDGVRSGKVKVSDFDRIRYFVLAEDSKAYNVCLD